MFIRKVIMFVLKKIFIVYLTLIINVYINKDKIIFILIINAVQRLIVC